MRNITMVNEQAISINTLFVQPSTYCGHNCPGCYIKEKEKITGPVGLKWHVYTGFLNQFLLKEITYNNTTTRNCYANQITLAVDSFAHGDGHEVKENNNMLLRYFKNFADYANIFNKKDTERHITIYSFNTILSYINSLSDLYYKELTKKKAQALFEQLDCISISYYSKNHEEDETETLRETLKEKTHLNLNIEAKYFIKAIRKDINILEKFDSFYVLLHKNALGTKTSPQKIADFKEAIEVINQLPDIYKAKINLDTCYKDSKKFAQNGNTCSAGISKFHVHPDGTVTGCPYSYGSTTLNIAECGQDVIRNIRKAAELRDFKQCTLPIDFGLVKAYKHNPLYILEE